MVQGKACNLVCINDLAGLKNFKGICISKLFLLRNREILLLPDPYSVAEVELAGGGFVTDGAYPPNYKLDGVGPVDNRPSTN